MEIIVPKTKKIALPVSADAYGKLFEKVTQRIMQGQSNALIAVNKELMETYWDIGKYIVEEQGIKSHGKSIVEKIAKDLQKKLPSIKGFSVRNLWYMRNLYIAYSDHTILQTLSADVLHKANLLVKDEYSFDFLELGSEYAERELEIGLIAKVQPFLAEMGGVFAFIGSQYKLEISNKEYFIDLLLYHRKLKCLVAVELKIGEFIPEYIGKMQFYLSALDTLEKIEGENPAIGIILCKSKDRTIVEFTLKDATKPIGVATYKVTKDLSKELKKQLPTPEQIAILLKLLD